MKSLLRPRIGGSLELLRKYINIGDDANWILLKAWLVAACRGKGPFVILIILGEQGSAKSTLVKIIRLVIDPSVAPIRTPPRKEEDLLIAASNALVVAYDNLSGIPHWLSDGLCRLSTGGGFSKRMLYTDADEVLFEAIRPVIVNGIDHLAERADLVDRAVILTLPPIEENVRRDEAQLYAELDEDLPSILGGLCTALSCALRRSSEVALQQMPRMADFAHWATAAEPALGLSPGGFMATYLGNRADAVAETLENDTVGSSIIALMDDLREKDLADRWDGSCKELLAKLGSIVSESEQKSPDWPKTPRRLSGLLKRLTTFLRASGIQVTAPKTQRRGARGKRIWVIERQRPLPTVSTVSTATRPSDGEPFQLGTGGQSCDGCSDAVAVVPPRDGEPPHCSPAPKPLNSGARQDVGTVETVETVENKAGLRAESQERYKI